MPDAEETEEEGKEEAIRKVSSDLYAVLVYIACGCKRHASAYRCASVAHTVARSWGSHCQTLPLRSSQGKGS